MDLSVVVVSWNTRALLSKCLTTLKSELESLGPNFKSEVFLIDNNSADGSAEMAAAEHPWVVLTANKENLGFAKANNQAFRVAKGRLVLLLNPDTEVQPGAIRVLIEFIDSHPDAAIVAPQLLNSDGSVQRSCREFPTFMGMVYELIGLSKMFPDNQTFGRYKMLDFNHDTERQVDQPEGACLLVRRAVMDEVGLLDEGFFMLFEEVDWCYRIIEAGYQIWFTPRAQVIHHYGQSIKQVKVRMILSSHRGLYRFWHKHYRQGRWYLDPIAYTGLMSLAYFRIFAHSLKQALTRS
ncbi:MAG: glycosyltransferase family 2 protein [Leptolyngbya sp.]|nr:glycosyltransferase family 2 protein [Candidatus Melainabacteria bacterium]